MSNSTPQPAWEEEFKDLIVKENWPLVDYENVVEFISSLLKEDTAATEHEKSMTDIAFAFEAGEKSGRAATLREAIESLPKAWPHEETFNQKARGFEHGYNNCREEITCLLQHKLTSEL